MNEIVTLKLKAAPRSDTAATHIAITDTISINTAHPETLTLMMDRPDADRFLATGHFEKVSSQFVA